MLSGFQSLSSNGNWRGLPAFSWSYSQSSMSPVLNCMVPLLKCMNVPRRRLMNCFCSSMRLLIKIASLNFFHMIALRRRALNIIRAFP